MDRKKTCSCGHHRSAHTYKNIKLEPTPNKLGLCTVKGCTCTSFYGDEEHRKAHPTRARRRILNGFVGEDDSTVYATYSVRQRRTEAFSVSEPKLFAEDPIAYVKMGVQAESGHQFEMRDIFVEQIVAQKAAGELEVRKAKCYLCGIRFYGPHAGMMSVAKYRGCMHDDDDGEEVVGDLCVDCACDNFPLPEPMVLSKRTGERANESPLRTLTKIVRNMEYTKCTAYEDLSMMQLIQVGIMQLESGWDFLPDQWTMSQLRQALMGLPPNWHNDTEKPKYAGDE